MPAKKPQGEYVREKQRTEEAVARAMADIHRSAVVFTERTLTYMEALGLPAEDMAALRDWNGVLYPKGCHRSREAAIILNAAPQLWNIILHTITPREHRKGDGKARIQTIPLRMWRDFWSDAAPGDTFRALARRVMTHAFAEAETRTPDIVDVAGMELCKVTPFLQTGRSVPTHGCETFDKICDSMSRVEQTVDRRDMVTRAVMPAVLRGQPQRQALRKESTTEVSGFRLPLATNVVAVFTP